MDTTYTIKLIVIDPESESNIILKTQAPVDIVKDFIKQIRESMRMSYSIDQLITLLQNDGYETEEFKFDAELEF